MRALVAVTLVLPIALLAGCAETPLGAQEVTDAPLAVEVLGHDERMGTCDSLYRQDAILVIKARITNPGLRAVGAPDYDISGLDLRGDDFPMCWHDEDTFAPGESKEVELVFWKTDADCEALGTVIVRQFYQGGWLEVARLPTGIKDPCA